MLEETKGILRTSNFTTIVSEYQSLGSGINILTRKTIAAKTLYQDAKGRALSILINYPLVMCIIIDTPYIDDAVRIQYKFMKTITFDIPILIYGELNDYNESFNMGFKEIPIQEETFTRGKHISLQNKVYTNGLLAHAKGGLYIFDHRIIHMQLLLISITSVYDLFPYNRKKKIF